MTAYCTYTDVDNLMSVTHTASTQPTIASVADFCADVSAELDGVAEAIGYTTPITSTAGLALMNSYATMGAAVKAWHAGFQAQTEPANVAYWREAYEGFLARLRRGEQTIPTDTSDGASVHQPAFSVGTQRAADINPQYRIYRRSYWGRRD